MAVMMAFHTRVVALRAALLLLCVASLSLGRSRSGAVGAVVRCEPCDAAARLLCKPLPRDCAERVREPGCGCCLTCALSFGQPCGVYTGRCGSGLTCQPQPGETKPLQALIEGRGICVNATSRRPAIRPTPPVNELPAEHTETQDKEQNSTDSSLQTSYNSHAGPFRPPHPPSFSSAKSDVLRQEPQKKTQSYKMEDLPAGPLITDQQNFALETKQKPEYGPCRREIESILSNLKITNILNPRVFRIPNCDKKGFYKKKQCRPSKGRKRGFCWCVDKYGQPLPGFDEKERGDIQHYNSDSQSE